MKAITETEKAREHSEKYFLRRKDSGRSPGHGVHEEMRQLRCALPLTPEHRR